jgi:hypothetical protein
MIEKISLDTKNMDYIISSIKKDAFFLKKEVKESDNMN